MYLYMPPSKDLYFNPFENNKFISVQCHPEAAGAEVSIESSSSEPETQCEASSSTAHKRKSPEESQLQPLNCEVVMVSSSTEIQRKASTSTAHKRQSPEESQPFSTRRRIDDHAIICLYNENAESQLQPLSSRKIPTCWCKMRLDKNLSFDLVIYSI